MASVTGAGQQISIVTGSVMSKDRTAASSVCSIGRCLPGQGRLKGMADTRAVYRDTGSPFTVTVYKSNTGSPAGTG